MIFRYFRDRSYDSLDEYCQRHGVGIRYRWHGRTFSVIVENKLNALSTTTQQHKSAIGVNKHRHPFFPYSSQLAARDEIVITKKWRIIASLWPTSILAAARTVRLQNNKFPVPRKNEVEERVQMKFAHNLAYTVLKLSEPYCHRLWPGHFALSFTGRVTYMAYIYT